MSVKVNITIEKDDASIELVRGIKKALEILEDEEHPEHDDFVKWLED